MAAEAEMEEKNSETIGQNQTNGDADAIEQSSVLNEKIKDDAPSPVIEGKSSASEGEVFIGAPSEDKLTSEQMFVDEGSTAKEKVSECREHLKIDENDEFEEAKDEALRSQLLPNVNLINDVPPTEQTTDESGKMDGQDETDVLESKEERDLGKRSEEYESPEKLPILEVKEKYPQNDGESTENNAEEQQSSEELGSIVHGKDEEEITESSHETPIEQKTNDSKIDTFSDAQLTNETLSVYEEKEPEETEEIAEALLDKGHHYENSDDQGGVEPEITTSNEEEIHHNEDREQQSEVKNNTGCMNPEKASVDEHSKAIEAINSTNVKSDDSQKEKEQADILVKSEEYSDAVATEATVGLEMVQDKPEESTVEDTLLSETKEADEAGETEKLNKGTINTEGPAVRLEEASHDASLDVPNEQEHGYQGEEETNAKTPDNTNTKEITIAIEQEDEAMTKVSSNNEETEGEKISSVKGDSEPKKVEDEYISNTVGDAPDTGEPNGKAAGIDDVVDDVQEETLGCTCAKQHQENVESNETNEDGEQGEEEHQTLQQEALVSEVENQETTSSTGANKMEISKEGENLMNMISESVNPEETKIENEMDDEKIKENVEDNPQDHALPSQTIHDAADEDQAGADQSLVGKDGDIASLEKENIKSKGPDEVQPSELEAHQSLVDKDHDIISLEEESIESKGPDEVQLSESEATEVGNIASEDKPKVAEIASTTDDAEITSVEGGESVDVDKDKAEYQQHENVRESVIEEENQGEATETQMAKSQEIPEMDDQSPEKASETIELMMKDIHDKTERKHEEEPDFANNEPINQTTVPEQSRIPEEENTIIENKTESIFPTDATENPLKSDPEEKDEEMLKNEETSHIFPEPSPDADHNIVEGLSHHDEGNKTCEHAARETASCDQSCEANEEQIEKPEKPNELKQDMPMKYSDTVNSQEETLNNENPDNVEDGEKYEGKDETTLTLERASAADFEEPSHRPFSNCEEISGATNLGYDFEPDSASNKLLHDNIESNESKENDEQREEKFQNPHDIESELEVKKEETTSEAESTKVSEPVNVDEDATIADTMDDESVKENVEDNPENNAVPPQTKHDAVGEKHQETEDSSSPPRDEESTETQGLDSTEEPVAEVQTAEAEDINAGYREDKEKPEVPESAGVNDDSETASMKEREDTKIDDSNINDALIEESNEIPDSFYEEKAHQLASTEEGNEVDVNEDKTECQEYNNISEPTAEQQNQEKENETELTKNSEVSEMGDITEDPESVKTKDENRMQENICGFLETQVLVTEEIREKVDIKHEEVPNSPCGDQSDRTSTTEGNVDFGRNKEKLPENLEAQKEPIIVPQEKNQIAVPDEKSGDTISKTETNKIENVEEENTNGDETSGLSFENSMSEFNSELACKEEKEEEIPKDEEISHILPEPAEVIPEKQTLGDDGNYEDPGCTIVEKVSHQDETSICEDVAPETVLDNQNKKAKENLEDATREEEVESAAESIKEKELEITEDIEEKEVGTEIQTSETNEIKDASYEISKCEEICTRDESTNISHQDEESENMNNKDEGSTFQKIDNTPVTTSLADEAALEYLHEDQKELATMADTEMQSRGQRNQEDDAELTTPKEQILEATTEVEPAKDEMSKDQNYKLDSEDSEGVNPKEEETVSRIHPTLPEETEEGIETKQEANPREEETTSKIHPTLPEETEGVVEIKQEANPNEEETTSKIHPTLPEETEEGTETKQQANPNHDEETHEHVIKNNVIDLDTLINGSKSEEPAEASEEISKEPSRVITTETGVVTEKGLMEGEVTTSEETNKLVFEDLDPRNDEKIEPPFIRALDEPVVPVTTSEETDKLVSKNLDLQNEKEVGSPQARENALDEQIVTPTNLVTTAQPVSTAKEDDAAAKESLKSIDQEVKDFNLVSDEHVHEQSETNPDDIQPLQDETTAEDSSSTKELNHELEMSAPAIASEDEIHDIKQASETTNETILEKENKEYQEVEQGNSEAKEKDGQDQQEIKRKQLIENECEPINTNECSKEIEDSGAIRGVTQDIEDSGAIRGVTQDNRNKEQEVHKIVETKETEYEKQEEQTAMEVFKGNQAIYKDETSKEESDPIGDRIGTSALEYQDKSSYHHNKTMHIDDTIAGVVAKEDVESAAENIKERELEIMENIEEIQTSETNEIKDAEYEVPQCEEICTYNESTKIAHQDEESENVNNKDEVKDFNLESDEHIQEKAETNQDGIQPLQDETTTEDPSSIKELKHELEMSTPAMASEDQIHQTKQASGTTNETVLEKENKEYVEIDVNSEAKEMDRQDQLEIERKQLTGNECEPINTDKCSKEIEDSGATLDVAQDNRNKEPEGPKSADTEEMEYEKEEEQTATEVFKANEAIYKDETSKEESNAIGDRIGTSAREYEDKSSYHHNEPTHVDDTTAGVVTKEEIESAAKNIKERELETMENIIEREVATAEIQTSETNEIKDAEYEVPQCDEICTHNENTNITHQDEESENVNNKDEGSTFQKTDNAHVPTSLTDEAALEYLHEDQKELPTTADIETESRLSRNQEDDSELTTSKEQNLEATTEVDTTRDEMSEDQNYRLANEEFEIANPKEEETASKIQTVLALPKETKEGIETNQEANPDHCEETCEHISKNNLIDLDTPINGNKSEELAEASAEILEEQSRAITIETEAVAEKSSMECEVTTSEETNKLVSEHFDPPKDEKVELPLIRQKDLDEPIVEVTTSEEAHKLVTEDLDAQNDKEVESQQIREKAADEQIETPTNLEPASTTKEDDATQEESLKSIDQEVKDLNLGSDEHIQEKAETNPDDIQPLQDETAAAEDAPSTKELKHELEMSAPAIASEDQIHQIKQASETTNETLLEKESKEYQEVEGDSEAKEMNGQDQEEINRKQLIGKEWELVNTNECNTEIEDGEAALGSIRDNKGKQEEVHKSAETKEMEYEVQEEETATGVIEANQTTYKDESSVEGSNVIGDRIGTSAPEYENQSSYHNDEPQQVDNTITGVVTQKEIVTAENEIFEEHENQSKNNEPDEELKPKETDATLNENPTDMVNEADAALAEKNTITDEKTEEEIKTREMDNDFASKEIVGLETVSEHVSTNWDTVSEALKANIMTLDDNEKDKDVTDKIVHNLGIEKEDTPLVVLSEKEIPEKLSTNEAIEDTQNEKESFPPADSAENEDKQQTEQDVLPVSRYLMDRILQDKSGNNDETLEVESEEMRRGKTTAQIADDTIVSKREVQDVKSAKDDNSSVEEHAHDPEKSIEKSLETNDGIQDNNLGNAPPVVAADEDVKEEFSTGIMSREKDPEKEVDADELKSKDLLQDDKIPITGPQLIETATPKASEEDAPNEGERCEVEMLSDIPKDDEVANETPEQQTSSLSDDAIQSVEIPQKSRCLEADYSTESSNDRENMLEEALVALPKSVEVGNEEVEKGQIPENSVLEVLEVVPAGLKDENGEENQQTSAESQTTVANVDLPEGTEVPDSQNVQKPDTKIESGTGTVELDEKCLEKIDAAAICTQEKQSEKVENAITEEGESDADKKDETKGGDEHKSDDFGHSSYVIVENEEGKQDKTPEVDTLEEDLETRPKDENAGNEEEKQETATESETMMTKVDLPDEPEVPPDSQKAQKLDTEVESAKRAVEPDEKCSEVVVNLAISAKEKRSEKVTGATSEEEKTDNDDDDEKDRRRGEDEHRAEDAGNNAAVIVEAREVELKPTHKKSHNILSGVGSKVKHSFAKVKKAITGKSSHPKTVSPR